MTNVYSSRIQKILFIWSVCKQIPLNFNSICLCLKKNVISWRFSAFFSVVLLIFSPLFTRMCSPKVRGFSPSCQLNLWWVTAFAVHVHLTSQLLLHLVQTLPLELSFLDTWGCWSLSLAKINVQSILIWL